MVATALATPIAAQDTADDAPPAPAAAAEEETPSVDGADADAGLRFGVGTGPVMGTYYPIGGTFAGLVESIATLQIEATGGSIENLVRLRVDDLDLAIARSDRVMQAVMGRGPFEPYGPDTGLRSLAVLFNEPLTLVARADSAVATVADLPGKRINIGEPGSPMRGVLVTLLDALGIAPQDLAGVEQIGFDEQLGRLCAGELDVIGVLAPHPSITVETMLTQCDTNLVGVDATALDVLLKEHPDYAAYTLPMGVYPGETEPVTMVGPVALLVGRDTLSGSVARAMVERLVVDLDRWRRSHPVLMGTTLNTLAGDGLAAPRHSGLTGG